MMFSTRSVFAVISAALCSLSLAFGAETRKIVLVAGAVKEVDKVGHHDYTGGVGMMEEFLKRVADVEVVVVKNGWPADTAVFEKAKTIVFYTDGGGAQAYLESSERIAVVQKLLDEGVGLVSIHQAVEFPPAQAKLAAEWMGGIYHKALSGRGHWDSKHDDFPENPIMNGVTPWEINDGWLNGFKFPAEMKGVTPLVWSGKEQLGSPAGGERDVVGWTFERKSGGRSFNFSGLDAHSAWERPGVRKLMINGILWSAGIEIPKDGADVEADKALVDSFLTPRTAPPVKKKS